METLAVIGLIYFFTWIGSVTIFSAVHTSFNKAEYIALIPTVAISFVETETVGVTMKEKNVDVTWIGWRINFKGYDKKRD